MDGRSPKCASCSATSRTSATCGGTCRSQTSILAPNWAALASEAAADQGAFWEMHDQMLDHQDKLRMADLVSYADRLGLDVARFTEDLQAHVGANGIARDVEGADLSPCPARTFFINGRRHHDAYDINTLSRAVRAAGAGAKLAAA